MRKKLNIAGEKLVVQRRKTNGLKHRERSSTISSNPEIQIKTNHYFGPVRFENFRRLISNMGRGMGIKKLFHTGRGSLN